MNVDVGAKIDYLGTELHNVLCLKSNSDHWSQTVWLWSMP